MKCIRLQQAHVAVQCAYNIEYKGFDDGNDLYINKDTYDYVLDTLWSFVYNRMTDIRTVINSEDLR